MCSTFKASAAALVLHRVDQGHESLDRRIVFTENDILSHAPVTKQHVGGDGMSVAELCEAALTQSDNTAANLLLASFGGPPALTHFWRSIGDSVTRADRKEPELNDIEPGDPRDTTTPIAMLHDLQKFVLGPVLKPASREQLTKWMVGNKTGDARLRAGIPRDWIGADRTGSGDRNTANDIAVIWPPRGKPILVTAFLTYGPASDEVRNKILADIGRAVAEDFSPDTARR
jgi:beta-lactamase class A